MAATRLTLEQRLERGGWKLYSTILARNSRADDEIERDMDAMAVAQGLQVIPSSITIEAISEHAVRVRMFARPKPLDSAERGLRPTPRRV